MSGRSDGVSGPCLRVSFESSFIWLPAAVIYRILRMVFDIKPTETDSDYVNSEDELARISDMIE